MTVLHHVGSFLLGLVVAVASIAVHRIAFPLGLVVSLATTFAVGWLLLGARSPRLAASYVAGWLAALLTALVGRPEGDFVLASDVSGYALMVAALPLVVVGLVGLTRTGRDGT